MRCRTDLLSTPLEPENLSVSRKTNENILAPRYKDVFFYPVLLCPETILADFSDFIRIIINIMWNARSPWLLNRFRKVISLLIHIRWDLSIPQCFVCRLEWNRLESTRWKSWNEGRFALWQNLEQIATITILKQLCFSKIWWKSIHIQMNRSPRLFVRSR